VEYGKADVEDILIRITVTNRGPEPAALRLLPTVWFRNTWSWGSGPMSGPRPELHQVKGTSSVELNHAEMGTRWLHCEGSPDLLFTENDTNIQRLFNSPNGTPYVKDGIDNYVVHGTKDAVDAASGEITRKITASI
jgi:hypothetical protein